MKSEKVLFQKKKKKSKVKKSTQGIDLGPFVLDLKKKEDISLYF